MASLPEVGDLVIVWWDHEPAHLEVVEQVDERDSHLPILTSGFPPDGYSGWVRHDCWRPATQEELARGQLGPSGPLEGL